MGHIWNTAIIRGNIHGQISGHYVLHNDIKLGQHANYLVFINIKNL